MFWVDVFDRSLDGRPDRRAGEALWRDAVQGGMPDAAAAAAWDRALRIFWSAAAARLQPDAGGPDETVRAWLEGLQVQPASGAGRGGFDWPALRARQAGSALPDAANLLLSTALLDLFAHGRMDGVARCAGAVRAWEGPWPYGAAHDRAFARRAGLPVSPDGPLRQCPHLVAAPRRGTYCSKQCANAGFALRKSLHDPAYFARKQQRYRSRQARASAAVERPFMFVN